MSIEKLKGQFIVIEGMDNAGKSSIANALAEKLREAGIECIVYGNPGGDELGQDIRKVIKSEHPRTADVDFLLLAANRIHLAHLVKEHLSQGITVIVDRWDMSADVYQGRTIAAGMKDRFYCQVMPLHQKMFELPIPDQLVLLNPSYDVVLSRQQPRSGIDRYEHKEGEFDQWYREMRTRYMQAFTYVTSATLWTKHYPLHDKRTEPGYYVGQYDHSVGHVTYKHAMLYPVTNTELTAKDAADEILKFLTENEPEALITEEMEGEHIRKHFAEKMKALAAADEASEQMREYLQSVGILPKDNENDKEKEDNNRTVVGKV